MHQMGGKAAVRATLATLALLVPAACSSSPVDTAPPAATVRTEPETTTTTDPYAVPAVIDAAYVNRVLAGLDAALGDVTRLVVRTRTIPPEAYDRLKSLYLNPDLLQLMIDSAQSDMRRGFAGYKSEPGNRASIVLELITAQRACIFAKVRRDYSAVTNRPPAELEIQWVGIKPLDPARDLSGYNMSKWAFVYDGFPRDHSQPGDPCAS